MAAFDVELHPGHEHLEELCSMYWATREDGSFAHPVKELSQLFDHPPHRITKIVSAACLARSTDHCCSECGTGFSVTSRAQWTTVARLTAGRCQECIATERRRQEKAREAAEAAKVAEVVAAFPILESSEIPSSEHLDMSEAFALAALFEDADEISTSLTVPVVARTDPFTPTTDLSFRLLCHLEDSRILRVHPSSALDSLVWNDDGTLGDSHYPVAVRYYLVGHGSLQDRVATYLESFKRLVSRDRWPAQWVDQFSEFWFDVAVAECKAYLVYMLKRHGLEFTPGPKTEDVFRRALRWYSIGQMYSFIWRAVEKSAAYLARERVPAKQAANSAVTRISSDVDRYYAQGWQVPVYQRDSRLPMSTLSRILFVRALGLDDPMSYSPVDLPVRRKGLELSWENIDSATFERLIFQLVVETEGYENVDWLMHTNAADHGRDVSAARLRRDPLSGHSSQRVAIQCKHWLKQSVRDVDVRDAIVSIEHWRDPPFDVLVIATSGRFTSDAVAYIERHNAKGERPSIEVWNDARLEALLSDRPHLIRAYELR